MRMTKPAQKRAFWGWAWWTPQILLAVGVAAFHAWTSIQIRLNDYEMAKHRREMDRLTAEMREVKVQMAAREEMGVVHETAATLGLQPPRPEQIIRLAYDPANYGPRENAGDQGDTPNAGEQGPRGRKPEPVMEIAQAAASATVAPRETGRLTMALDLDAGIAAVNAAIPGAAAVEAPSQVLDKSVDQMLGEF